MREVISIHIGQAGELRRSVACSDCAGVEAPAPRTVAHTMMSVYKLRSGQFAAPTSKLKLLQS
jgi:hypothetical protein